MSGRRFIARAEIGFSSSCDVSHSRGFNRPANSVHPGHVVHPCPTSPGLSRKDKPKGVPVRAYSRCLCPKTDRLTRGCNTARNLPEVPTCRKREFNLTRSRKHQKD